MRNERLQVQDSILLLKIKTLAKAGRTLHEGRKVTGSRQYSAIKKSLWKGRQNSASGTRGCRFRTMFCCKKIILARQAEHFIQDKRL